MKRTILALTLAGLSFSALALPPPGAGSGNLNVTVTNTVLPVEVRNAPERQPFRFVDIVYLGTSSDTNKLLVTVPDNKRLVIEQISWQGGGLTGYEITSVILRTAEYGPVVHHFRINAPHASRNPAATNQDGSEVTRLYFEPGEKVWINVTSNVDDASGNILELAMHGYYVTL